LLVIREGAGLTFWTNLYAGSRTVVRRASSFSGCSHVGSRAAASQDAAEAAEQMSRCRRAPRAIISFRVVVRRGVYVVAIESVLCVDVLTARRRSRE